MRAVQRYFFLISEGNGRFLTLTLALKVTSRAKSRLSKPLSPSEISSMGQFTSFAEILENKLRKEIEGAIRSEIRTETKSEPTSNTSFQPDVISLLLGRVSPVKASNLTKASLYHQHRPKVRPQAPPKPAHKLTAEQSKAFQQFAAWGLGLADNFSSKDLKTAFRKRALKAHPDQGGNTLEFYQLQECYSALISVFNK